MRKSSLIFSSSSCRHWLTSFAGTRMRIRRARPRQMSSFVMMAASMVFPSPTSSAKITPLVNGLCSAQCATRTWWGMSEARVLKREFTPPLNRPSCREIFSAKVRSSKSQSESNSPRASRSTTRSDPVESDVCKACEKSSMLAIRMIALLVVRRAQLRNVGSIEY